MKSPKTINNIKLGLFVLAGALFLIFSLYMIGRNRNLFGPTFAVSANFRNINGLMVGNNVRFAGIDVGTVSRIRISSDSSVTVEMIIDKQVRKHIKQNAIASIGTDGLMGNKLVNINSVSGPADLLENGTLLQTEKPIETDQMLRTLSKTNENMAAISLNLREISTRLNESNSLWTILGDTQMTFNLKSAAAHLDHAMANTEGLTAEAAKLISNLKSGDGLANSLFTDTVMKASLNKSLANIERVSQNLSQASTQITEAVYKLEHGKGPAGMLLSDSTASQKLNQSLINIEQGTDKFNENMEALRHHPLFRKYFKDQEDAKAGGK